MNPPFIADPPQRGADALDRNLYKGSRYCLRCLNNVTTRHGVNEPSMFCLACVSTDRTAFTLESH